MKFRKAFCCIGFSLFSLQAGEPKSDFDLEELDRSVQEDRKQLSENIRKRDGIDGPWMIKLFSEYRTGEEISDEDLRRVWKIFDEESERIDDKLYAFSLITEFEDISKWEKEFDYLAFSHDPRFVKAALQMLIHKLGHGSEREKIVLANKTDVLKKLEFFVRDNSTDTTIRRDAAEIIGRAKPFAGRTPSAGTSPPRIRQSEPHSAGAWSPRERVNHCSLLESDADQSGVRRFVTILGFAAISIAAFLIWFRRPNSNH